MLAELPMEEGRRTPHADRVVYLLICTPLAIPNVTFFPSRFPITTRKRATMQIWIVMPVIHASQHSDYSWGQDFAFRVVENANTLN